MTRKKKRDDASERMRDVSHTNPYTGETFTTVYERGPAVTDGSGASDSTPEMTGGSETMEDVDHTPRNGDGANRVWKRGKPEDDSEEHSESETASGDVGGGDE
ncbi:MULTISPECIES: hypothetical protein [Haloferax]|uniref:Uncharacterized protein n=2 Tax=Haloferax TaxID=2251 RepID=A0A6G1Z3E1_9EURY|nr:MULTISPECIES: hypothetical protein [Haloferax]KAB1188454.1 hypothetical protein Hfx1149_10585 [Haloferax sp. CBA1149]MRW81147.1 hypothetical protein [Haloferax marinisediminis]